MARYSISKRFEPSFTITEKVAGVMRMFGVTAERLRECSVEHRCEIDIECGDVVYITGASGAGKSVILRELKSCFAAAEVIDTGDISLASDRAVIDCLGGEVISDLRILSLAGLNDVFCVLNTPAQLSDGQKWRFRLACAVASGRKAIFADEFCSGLDRITAAVISYNVRRFAAKNKVTFILAGSTEDILSDLRPDVLVTKELGGRVEVIYRDGRRG